MNTILAIAGGGAIGAVLRHGFNVMAVRLLGHGFPWGTLGVNVIGSFIMGVLIALFAHFYTPSPALRVFLVTGFLGAFTTFSTFSLDAVSLYERGDIGQAAGYIVLSVVLSVAALVAGLVIIRGLSV